MELPKHNVMKYFLEGVHIHIFDVHATMIAYDIFEKFKHCQSTQNIANYFSQFYNDNQSIIHRQHKDLFPSNLVRKLV